MSDIAHTRNYRVFTGKMAYCESVGAWNTIRLKKTILEDFIDLKQKREKFRYEISVPYKYEEIDFILKEAKKEGRSIPMLIWIKRDKNDY